MPLDVVRRNPDQALIRCFQTRCGASLPITSNPLAAALGGMLCAVHADRGEIALEFNPGGAFAQGAQVLQGGIVSAMLDFAMAFAVLAALPDHESCTTVNLNVSFLRPAPLGTYRSVGLVERRGRSLAFARAALHGSNGELVATATSTLTILS